MISIFGPTAIGKTSFSFDLIESIKSSDVLSKTYEGYDIISADSRQVYKDLMVISGADVPSYFKNIDGTYVYNDVSLHGLLILDYQDEWSLAHFKNFAEEIIRQSWREGRLPIIVGGTGLYHDHLFNDSGQIWIGPNEELREKLEQLSLEDLQDELRKIDSKKLQSMNNSDSNNPVRLIRAIEVASSSPGTDLKEQKTADKVKYQSLAIGLTDELESIKSRIKQRVIERFENGAIKEVETIKQKSQEFSLNKQLTTATGVKEVQAFLDGQIEKEACIEKWVQREYQYAKRQLTWWRKKKDVSWHEVGKDGWKEDAFKSAHNFLLSEKI